MQCMPFICCESSDTFMQVYLLWLSMVSNIDGLATLSLSHVHAGTAHAQEIGVEGAGESHSLKNNIVCVFIYVSALLIMALYN